MGSVLVCSVINIIEFSVFVEKVFLSDAMATIGTSSFLSILGSRLLVNLREAGELGLNKGTNYRLDHLATGDISFAEGNVKG